MKYLIIFIFLVLLGCDSSSSGKNYDCVIREDPYDDTIYYIDCPDGTVYTTEYGAGLTNGDIVDIETQVDILEVR